MKLSAFMTLLGLSLLSSAARAQTVSVQIMTDAPSPSPFISDYPLGQTSLSADVYGPTFLISVTHDLTAPAALSFSLSGGQPDYTLFWTVVGSGTNHSFGVKLGADVTGVTGSASNVYYRDDGTLQLLPTNATRYRIGVRASPTVTADLNTQVTLTLTTN
ncbi:hypothetical protein GCM10010840_36380 [Deinococcus aerolatus]|uniref:DUF4402 domain-containing protein n=1 Tax=Deinococcus aerolatus TaxID=522487 RepID=A0ABQ2GGV0_9DEIO|nr:hypothetical protein [Deinococcus aerolatus]GGL95033.1 hypothetical protein GCM10010840_36380 [Deinococcus aerolatus]